MYIMCVCVTIVTPRSNGKMLQFSICLGRRRLWDDRACQGTVENFSGEI